MAGILVITEELNLWRQLSELPSRRSQAKTPIPIRSTKPPCFCVESRQGTRLGWKQADGLCPRRLLPRSCGIEFLGGNSEEDALYELNWNVSAGILREIEDIAKNLRFLWGYNDEGQPLLSI
jgi:hypothetical protein